MKSIEILTSFFCANASFCLAVKIENKNKIHDSNFTDFIGSVGLPETAYFEGHRLHIWRTPRDTFYSLRRVQFLFGFKATATLCVNEVSINVAYDFL